MAKIKYCLDCNREKNNLRKELCDRCYERRLYHKSEKRRESCKRRSMEWRKKNPEAWKKIVLRAVKKYQKANPEKFKEADKRYKAKKKLKAEQSK